MTLSTTSTTFAPTFGGKKKKVADAVPDQLNELNEFISKQKPGLVRRKVKVHRAGKEFEREQWVRPEESEAIKVSHKDMFNDFMKIDYNRLVTEKKSKKVKRVIENIHEHLNQDRAKNMDKFSKGRGYFMIDSWVEGAVFKIVGLRMLVAEMRGEEISKEMVKSLMDSVSDKPTPDKTVEAAMSIGKISYMEPEDWDHPEKGASTNKSKQVIKDEHEYAVKKTKELFGDEITVYRGIYGKPAQVIRDALDKSDEIELDSFPLSSYSQDPIAAFAFVHDKRDKVVIQRKIKADDVQFAWYSNPAMLSYMPEQKEVVISPKENKFIIKKSDVIWR